jgi:tripartite motif-containing protein 2/3
VRNITKKISDLNEKLDTTSTLSEPRENSFLRYEYKHNDALREIAKAVGHFGHIAVSTTFPALSTGTQMMMMMMMIMMMMMRRRRWWWWR